MTVAQQAKTCAFGQVFGAGRLRLISPSQLATYARSPRQWVWLYARFRLDVARDGGPFIPASWHATHAEAFDAGLLVVVGQNALAREPAPGSDFRIKDTRGAS